MDAHLRGRDVALGPAQQGPALTVTEDQRSPGTNPSGAVAASYEDRRSWILAAIWLVWMVNPVVGVLEQPSWILRIVGFACIALFCAVYIRAWQLLPRWGGVRPWTATPPFLGRRLLVCVLMLAIGLAMEPLAGLSMVAVLPYIGAYAIASLPRVPMMLFVGSGLGTLVVIAMVLDQEWPYWLLVGYVVMIVALMVTRSLQLERKFSREAEEMAVVSQERERVARDLHDTLGQSLTVVTVKLALAEKLLEKAPAASRQQLADCTRLTRQALAEVRDAVTGLRVARLDDELATGRTALAAVGISATFPDDSSIVDVQNRQTMAWALRELLTNVMRHSKASNVEVAWGPDWLEVVDDGVGMRGRRAGNGLAGLTERLSVFDGQLMIESISPHGTRVRVQL